MNMRQTPMAYSPQTGYLYASVCVNPAWVRRAESPWVFITPIRVPGQQQYGLMAAIDSRTLKTVWQKRVDYAGCEGGGGATATAGGLVFHVEPDGEFQAYDAKNGDVRLALPDRRDRLARRRRARRRLGDLLSRRRRAVRGADDEPPHLGVQTRRRARSGAGASRPPLVLPWSGRVDETGTIQLGTVTVFNVQSAGRREEWRNAYGVNPSRTRVAAGAPVTFTNTTTIDAHDRGAGRIVEDRPDRARRDRRR